MKNEEQLFEKIEQYIKGKLSPLEATEFEQNIKRDPALAERVRMHRMEHEALELLIGERLREKISSWNAVLPDAPAEKKTGYSQLNRTALGIMALLGIAIALYIYSRKANTVVPPVSARQTDTSSHEEIKVDTTAISPPPIADKTVPAPKEKGMDKNLLALAQTNFHRPDFLDEGYIRNTDGSPGGDSLKEWKALLRFANPDYGKVIAGVSQLRNKELQQQAAPILAYAYFKTGQMDMAASLYEQLATSTNLSPAERDDAEWRLLLSLLPDKRNQEQVRRLMIKMTTRENFHEFQQQALQLQSKI